MGLTKDDIRAFIDDGLLIRRDLVPHGLTTQAHAHITRWYREEMDPALVRQYTQRTFAPHLGSHPDLLALFDAPDVVGLVEELIGTPAPVTTTQIQIRLPEADLGSEQPEKSMHVDGVACPHLDPDELRTFSLLIGVVLSDLDVPEGGALHYQPGGHHTMAEWFRSEWALGLTEQVPPHLDANQGTPFLGRTGDVLLMHHLVPHSVGRNILNQPRIMAYFRVSHVDHVRRRLEALKDPWLDFPPLRDHVPASR
ncbi:phytanoyl-CoA dioxygenase family protein [Nocardiopsis sp. NPDC050513]|uniref:phytanoyl-CoA dioxygenase family protein n=1 Tax=Nocardiopsis sp. NPDC050513 TaxID=3364338 RepID=UPI0037BD8330